MVDYAVIFDVDGVLLELTRDEEELFFEALSKFVPTQNLSRDWNSYIIRNDENIIAEILERNNLPHTMLRSVIDHYINVLKASSVPAFPVAGAAELLQILHGKAYIGIATANLLSAAQHRLEQTRLWTFVSDLAFGADGGGHKKEILGRALQRLGLPPQRVVYVGDNINDVKAGLAHSVHFIGFSENAERRALLQRNGVQHLAKNHLETLAFINTLLA